MGTANGGWLLGLGEVISSPVRMQQPLMLELPHQ